MPSSFSAAHEKAPCLTERELVTHLIRERSMILGYAQSIVGNHQAAEDIYQEVAVVALRKRNEISELGNPGAWFRKIARFLAMNVIRKSKPSHLAPEVVEMMDAVWSQNSNNLSDKLDGLRSCLSKLPPKLKEVIEMRYHGEMKSQVVAEELGLSLSTVYIYVSKAHGLLRTCVDQYLSSNDVPSEGLDE